MPAGSAPPAEAGAISSATPPIAQAVPAHQRRLSPVPRTIRSQSPVETGASPNTTAVAMAAPVRFTDVKKAAWNVPVAAAAASSGPQVRRVSARNARRRVTRTSAARIRPPEEIRAPPTATGLAADSASTCAGPTVPQSTPATSTSNAPDDSFRRYTRSNLEGSAPLLPDPRTSFG
nr:hypothetical protein [Actinomadura catellatispora]